MKPDALLVIDIQHGFMQKGAEAVVAPIKDLIGTWPKEHLYFLKYRNYPNSLFARHLDWQEMMTATDADFVPGIHVEGTPIFEHYGYQPPAEMITTLKKYKTVGICGVDTDACVMAAVFALWDAEIRPLVLSAYCASSGGPHFHKTAIDLMLRQFGTESIIKEKIA